MVKPKSMAGISTCEFLTAISLRGVDCGDYIKQGQMLSGRAFRDQPLSKPPLAPILKMIYKVAKVSLDN
jgi:energy-converting hydrogenase Eha subunit F